MWNFFPDHLPEYVIPKMLRAPVQEHTPESIDEEVREMLATITNAFMPDLAQLNQDVEQSKSLTDVCAKNNALKTVKNELQYLLKAFQNMNARYTFLTTQTGVKLFISTKKLLSTYESEKAKLVQAAAALEETVNQSINWRTECKEGFEGPSEDQAPEDYSFDLLQSADIDFEDMNEHRDYIKKNYEAYTNLNAAKNLTVADHVSEVNPRLGLRATRPLYVPTTVLSVPNSSEPSEFVSSSAPAPSVLVL